MLDTYRFDIVALTETWLKENKALIDYVTIPDYDLHFNNRLNMKGGGVAYYVSSRLHLKRRKDLENFDSQLEHIWLEVPGKNKHSKLLIGVVYRSQSLLPFAEWLEHFEDILVRVKSAWNGPLMLTGDFNIDLLKSSPKKSLYLSTLYQFDLTQIITSPTRTTEISSTLIDHISVDNVDIVSKSGVLPCSTISDHDGTFALLNIKVPRYEPRLKLIRSEKKFDLPAYISDVASLPFSIIYGVDDPSLKLELFNKLILSCIDSHAPLRKMKLTRPPAPWINNTKLKSLMHKRDTLRLQAHETKDPTIWKEFRELRNLSKKKILHSKMSYYRKSLSSSISKDVWKIIHSILHPPPKRNTMKPDSLNSFFAATALRTVGKDPISPTETKAFIDTLPNDNESKFTLRYI
ncbi:uncharacterized protein LOC130642193 [Hydractinia symbiolongicarpus]|uniref:uncharacterized protein LOC130642193 n=1 Tax=Hydractinia symbiolongicarpus TaxID=13093 RepID=UPI00254DBF44|nr:uncharacterized protein LOC130642193 [Hydractinia symbiolongicarpus]